MTSRQLRERPIRNYYPEKPYVGWIAYRNVTKTMKELMRMHARGELEGPQRLWMSNNRPPEELYDVENDPHELNNLANDFGHAHILKELRGVLDAWRVDTGDLGDLSEVDMVERFWPGKVQPETHAPLFFMNAEDSHEMTSTEGHTDMPNFDFSAEDSYVKESNEDGVYEGPAMLRMSCPTQGASIAYTTDNGDRLRWLLYSGPFHIEGTVTVRAKAIRYGYKESPEVTASFTIQE